jgi:hypothetical protein
VGLLDRWLDRIANYFIDHHSSSVVEGRNNTLNVLKRCCYGIITVGRLFQRLTRAVEGYRRFSPWLVTHHYIADLSRQFPKTLYGNRDADGGVARCEGTIRRARNVP